jgi:hypothetical protein
MDPFDGCWKRIDRAEAHRVAFSQGWESLIKDDSYATVVEMESDGASGSVRIIPTGPIDTASLALDIGEMLYQLRAAIDGAVYDAAVVIHKVSPPPDDEKLQFPIARCDTEWEGLAKRYLRPLTDQLRDYIKSVQPYLTPADPFLNVHLGILNHWARKDRHRRLHVIGSAISDAQFRIVPQGPALITWQTIFQPNLLAGEDILATFGIGGFQRGMDIHVDGEFTMTITIDESPKDRAAGVRFDLLLLLLIAATKKIVLEISIAAGSP